MNRTCPALLLLAGAIFASPPALATCTLGRLAELPVTMLGLKPVLEAKINDQDVRLVADTGAAYSVLTPAAAARLNLRLEHAALGFSLEAVGGSAELWVTRVKTFKLINAVFHDVGFLVAGNDLGEGLAGQNYRLVVRRQFRFAAFGLVWTRCVWARRSILGRWQIAPALLAASSASLLPAAATATSTVPPAAAKPAAMATITTAIAATVATSVSLFIRAIELRLPLAWGSRLPAGICVRSWRSRALVGRCVIFCRRGAFGRSRGFARRRWCKYSAALLLHLFDFRLDSR